MASSNRQIPTMKLCQHQVLHVFNRAPATVSIACHGYRHYAYRPYDFVVRAGHSGYVCVRRLIIGLRLGSGMPILDGAMGPNEHVLDAF